MHTKKIMVIFIASFYLILFLSILNGCDLLKNSGSTENVDYNEMKQMVTDILQTDESKKIIQKSLQDPEIKNKLVMNNDEVKTIIENELLSSENHELLMTIYEDPEFASKLAETLKSENEKLLKGLMKDPEYREMLIETMNEEEFKKILLEVMKSNEYRNQMMVVIKDTFETPTFKNELLNLIEKAAKKVLETDNEK